MNAKPLPYVWTEEPQTTALPVLPARPGYLVVSDELDARLKAASQRVEAGTDAEREAAEADVVAVWKDMEAHEADCREAARDEEFERNVSPREQLR